MKRTERQLIASYICIHGKDMLRLLAVFAFAMLFLLPDIFVPAHASAPSVYDLYEAGKTEEAKGIVEEVLKKDPKNHPLRMLYAEILRKEGKPLEAKEQVTRAILGGLGNGYAIRRGAICRLNWAIRKGLLRISKRP